MTNGGMRTDKDTYDLGYPVKPEYSFESSRMNKIRACSF